MYNNLDKILIEIYMILDCYLVGREDIQMIFNVCSSFRLKQNRTTYKEMVSFI